MKKTAITYGTFDLFHYGHLRLFQRIKEFSDYLIVAVSTDEFNQLKGKKTIIPFENRIEIVKNIRYVDKVIAEESWDQKLNDIKNYNVNFLVMGDDWKGKFDELNNYCEVIYLPRTDGISSSLLKNSLSGFRNLDISSINSALEILQQIRNQLS
ncbi:MAG: adenylyltransferase/cytidyltransferase family protein [Ignavibacterium album]|uniref:adenylyltransferase/cytidyltransferase family protein n=1 Tax=Ignavibacterium album TaxID=591197 RepID=UPI00350E3356|nr:adenylyltransferase/cytidyltransferase family protein [Ignavibacterium album]